MKAKKQVLPDVAITAFDSCRARTMPVRSPLSSVTPALSIATSVPVAHRDADIGRGQCRRVVDAIAGHRHDPAGGFVSLHHGAFLVRQDLGLDLLDPSRRATARAVVQLSPVSITTRMRSALSAASAAGVDCLTGSAMAITPAGLSSMPTKIAVAPSLAKPICHLRKCRGVDALLAEES
jgi:hypothetical protein